MQLSLYAHITCISSGTQFYDASMLTETAARQLVDYLATTAASSGSESHKQRASSIAAEALQEDENLLAFALAAPGHRVAVVDFRDPIATVVTASPAHVVLPAWLGGGQTAVAAVNQTAAHAFFGTYWRELVDAWNRSDGAQHWGAPFRECGALRGRWLWPFSVTVEVGTIK